MKIYFYSAYRNRRARSPFPVKTCPMTGASFQAFPMYVYPSRNLPRPRRLSLRERIKKPLSSFIERCPLVIIIIMYFLYFTFSIMSDQMRSTNPMRTIKDTTRSILTFKNLILHVSSKINNYIVKFRKINNIQYSMKCITRN